jgi:hypothetical protein
MRKNLLPADRKQNEGEQGNHFSFVIYHFSLVVQANVECDCFSIVISDLGEYQEMTNEKW